MMENKVSNDLFARFMADPLAKRLLQKYSGRSGCQKLVRGEWKHGGFAVNKTFVGVGEKNEFPVFRVTVTEAHCFAEWLGGLLPTQQQWGKAAGWDEGPAFDGDPQDMTGLALGLKDGPRPVDWGNRDVSIYGCRQMASNGYEWTRDLADEGPGPKMIPLDRMTAPRFVICEGQTYFSEVPLTKVRQMAAASCTDALPDVSFRVVLENWSSR
jgi:formylglycine-generating enzyme required for sulfatase activity